jgi:hypothetical protein
MRQSSLASGQPGRGGGGRLGGRPGPPAARARPSRSRPGPPAASAQMREHSRARRQGGAVDAPPSVDVTPAPPRVPRARRSPAGTTPPAPVGLSGRRLDAEFDHGQEFARSALSALHSAPRDGGRAGSRWGIPHLSGLAWRLRRPLRPPFLPWRPVLTFAPREVISHNETGVESGFGCAY